MKKERERNLKKFYRKLDDIQLYIFGHSIFEYRMKEFEEILSRHKELFGKVALDVGCGGGASTFALERLGLKVTGIDIQKDMVNRAKKTAREICSDASFILMDIHEVDIKEKFDSIFILGNTLIHMSLEDFVNIIKKINNMIQGNGVLVVHYFDVIRDIINQELFIKSPKIADKRVEFSYDLEKGAINIMVIERELREDLYEAERFSIYIWSPWILENIMKDNGYKLEVREYLPNCGILDIYKKYNKLRN